MDRVAPEDRREDRAELLAHHYVEAVELARSAGIDISELEPKAATALREAGMRAFAIGAFPTAVRALRAAEGWSADGLDARALRVLGKALLFTEQRGHDELREAFDRELAAGARAEAAVAAIDLALAIWQRGDGRGTAEWTTRSLELVDGAPPSLEHAHVLAQAARLEMLAGRGEASIAAAARAIELASVCGAEAPRASALVTQATARANTGDYARAREDLEEAQVIAREHDPSEVGRVYVNLSSILLDLGELRDAIAMAREGLAYHQRSGMAGGTGGFIYGNLCEACFHTGAWDEAAAIATAELERARKAGGLYYEPMFRYVLAEMALLRDGDVENAVVVARQLVDAGSARGDDQAVYPTWSAAAWILVRTGHEAEAAALIGEVLERRRANPRGSGPAYWILLLSLALERLGRSGELAALDEPPGSHFLASALMLDSGRFVEAADLLHEIGAPQLEAEVRSLATREGAGDDRQLQRARELLQALGATARLRELDAARL